MSYTICWCGYPETNHNFRHLYENRIKVERRENKLVLNREEYPDKTTTKCGEADCSGVEKVHNTISLPHVYKPVQVVYKEIRVCIPEDIGCKRCERELGKHKEEMTHIFELDLEVVGKENVDKVVPLHPVDEDIKIKV